MFAGGASALHDLEICCFIVPEINGLVCLMCSLCTSLKGSIAVYTLYAVSIYCFNKKLMIEMYFREINSKLMIIDGNFGTKSFLNKRNLSIK